MKYCRPSSCAFSVTTFASGLTKRPDIGRAERFRTFKTSIFSEPPESPSAPGSFLYKRLGCASFSRKGDKKSGVKLCFKHTFGMDTDPQRADPSGQAPSACPLHMEKPLGKNFVSSMQRSDRGSPSRIAGRAIHPEPCNVATKQTKLDYGAVLPGEWRDPMQQSIPGI
jgi:hypothetical protein